MARARPTPELLAGEEAGSRRRTTRRGAGGRDTRDGHDLLAGRLVAAGSVDREVGGGRDLHAERRGKRERRGQP
jgi:hypothetical protein